jgi:DNA-directed RNA polymerase specialized sigma24 family protein
MGMPAAEPGPEWILSSFGSESRSAPSVDNELIKAARSAWPKALAHARRERSRNRLDHDILATEVWERLLLSVAKTIGRLNGRRSQITDMEAYLLGSFYHRFSRALRKEYRREEIIHLVSSFDELEAIAARRDTGRGRALDASIYAAELIRRMDSWSRTVWIAHEYGYSWKEIGRCLGISGDQALLRFRRRMQILRERLLRHK